MLLTPFQFTLVEWHVIFHDHLHLLSIVVNIDTILSFLAV